MSELDRFLSGAGDHGRYFETSEFTIDSLKAREKLSQFQLADSGLWLVKLVQAAVASKAPRVDITFGKNLVRVRIANTRKLSAENLLAQVLSGSIPKDRVLFHLITGLRASAASVNETVSWDCGGAKVTLDTEGSRSEEATESEELVIVAQRPSRTRSLTKNLSSSVFHLVKQTVEEYDAVRSRCWASPIPIFLDGKELDRGYYRPTAGEVETNPMNLILKFQKSRGQAIQAGLILAPDSEHQGESNLPYPIQAKETVKSVLHKNRNFALNKPTSKGELFLQERTQTEEVPALFLLYSEHKAKSSLDFILDGALVDRHPFSNAKTEGKFLGIEFNQSVAGCRYIIPVRPEELDLSQFKVREPDLPHFISRSKELVARELTVLESLKSQFWYNPFTRLSKTTNGLGLGAHALVIASATKGIGLVPYAGFIGAVAGYNLWFFRNQMVSYVRTLKKELKSLEARPGF